MSEARLRILRAAHDLFCANGFNGTSLNQVTARSGLPTGSVYHHFPGGKQALGVEVIQHFGAEYGERVLTLAAQEADAASAVRCIFQGAAAVVEELGFVDPCPVGGIARESASSSSEMAQAADDVFQSWVLALTDLLRGDQALAVTVVAAIEGGFTLSRARRSGEPLRQIGEALSRLAEGVAGNSS